MTGIANLLCEYRTNPLGIDVTTPRLSWQMQSDRRGARQTAYRIFAASDVAWLSEGKADLWDSGKIESDQSVHIVYAGQRLRSRQRVYWKVTVWDETGGASQRSRLIEMGLLKPKD
jgi:alpha-L-rhamnosidase